MFELRVDVQEIQNPTVPIRWRVDKPTLEAIKASGAKKASVDVFCRDGHTVPLSDGGTYVSFVEPGQHRVLAEIVSDRGERFGRAEIDVLIPAECFPRPAQERWDYSWLTALIDVAPRDECALRRRRMFAYTVQPAVLGFLLGCRIAISLVIVSVMLLMGMRGIDWKAHFDLNSNLEDLLENDGSVFLPRWKSPLRYLCLAFMPLLLIIFAFFGLVQGLATADAFGSALALLSLVFSGVAIVAAVAAFTGTTAGKVVDSQYALPGKDDYLLLGDDSARARKPIRLRYRSLKARVCRPFKV